MRLHMKLVPRETGNFIEQVEIWTKLPYEDDDRYYPLTFAHIDTFYNGKVKKLKDDLKENEIWEKLNANEIVYVEANIVKKEEYE